MNSQTQHPASSDTHYSLAVNQVMHVDALHRVVSDSLAFLHGLDAGRHCSSVQVI